MSNRKNLAMLAMLYGSAFAAAFNENTINVALISIMGEFAVDANTAQWLVTGCMITFGPAFAPVVSGLMVTTLGWRSIFLPPAVLIVALALMGLVLIRNIAEPEKIKLDGASVVLSAVGLTSFVFGLSLVMASPAVAAAVIALGLVVMGVFVMRQRRIPNPLLNLEPMCNRLFAPILVNAVTSLVGGRIMDKRGSWPLLPAGFAVITVGQLAVCLCAPALSLAGVLVASVVVYAGVGLVLSPSQTAGLQTLSPEQNPHGVAILNTFIQIAAAVGPSLFIGVLSSVAGLAEAEGTAAALAQAEGFSVAVAAACAIAAAGTLTALAYARKRQRLAEEQTTGATTAEAAGDGDTAGETATLDNTMSTPAPTATVVPVQISALESEPSLKSLRTTKKAALTLGGLLRFACSRP